MEGQLPLATAGHGGHCELSEIWRDVGLDDSVRCTVVRAGSEIFGGGDLALVQVIAADFELRTRAWIRARDLPHNVLH
jgi:enoyl-CoA hydratase